MNLLIDQGNTLLKYGLEENGEITNIESGQLFDLRQFIEGKNITAAYVCSVKNINNRKVVQDLLDEFNIAHKFAETEQEKNGLRNSYEDLDAMGTDRWLGMLGIWSQLKGEFVLIDCGTAITFDHVDSTGQHKGGHIVPGLNTMVSALVDKTDKINVDLAKRPQSTRLANNTEDAVKRGCLASITGYLNEQLNTKPHRKVSLFITGGEAEIFAKHLLIKPEFVKYPVLEGLCVHFLD